MHVYSYQQESDNMESEIHLILSNQNGVIIDPASNLPYCMFINIIVVNYIHRYNDVLNYLMLILTNFYFT